MVLGGKYIKQYGVQSKCCRSFRSLKPTYGAEVTRNPGTPRAIQGLPEQSDELIQTIYLIDALYALTPLYLLLSG